MTEFPLEILDTHWIEGRWVPSSGRRPLLLLNPTTEEPFAQVIAGDGDDVDRAVRAARAALPGWEATDTAQRSALLRRIRDRLGEQLEPLAREIAREIGSPLWFGRAMQVPMPMGNLSAMADALNAMTLEEAAGTSTITREAIGVVGAITPWNAPLHQIISKIGGALAAGCTTVLKPSELTPRTVRLLIDILHDAGVPPGVINVVFGDGDTGRLLVEHPGLDMVSFTGSVAAGRRIGEATGRGIRKVGLELGGKSAALLMLDAPLDAAVAGVLRTCFANSGQVCVAQSRMIVPEVLAPAVENLCKQQSLEWRVGLPTEEATRVGPLATAAGRERVLGMVGRGLAEGARVVCGGVTRPEGMERGFFVRPTVLADVSSGMEIAQEEVFGPVLVIQTYYDLDEAVALANGTSYGLSGAVWSADRDAATAVARRMRSGQVSVNGAPQNYATPFGGRGLSGIGRENGRFSIEEFLEWKAIHGVRAPAA
jgi:acyl-CoA reductase-like NAD-dependent aldehyde dehydrogenase